MPFLFAVAILAAALGDPLVETISNSGVFGPGYADDNHASVIPSLIAALAIAAEIAFLRALQSHGLIRSGGRDWAREFAARSRPDAVFRDLICVVALQLPAVYIMEYAEQLVAGGTPAGGTAWLGGPIFFSLCAHATVAAVALAAAGRLMRALLRTFCSLIAFALEGLPLGRALPGAFCLRRREPPQAQGHAPHVRHTGRAPPLFPASA